MFRKNLTFLIALTTLTGCASSSDLAKKANRHAKSASYYQSIGHHKEAQDEYNEAVKNRKDANKGIAIFVELYNLFIEQE